MADCNNISSINSTQGTTQAARLQAALQPDYFRIEERSISDFIGYAQQLAAQLKYFNLQNQEDGDWTNFFASEPIAVMVYLAKYDGTWSERLQGLKRDLLLTADETERKQMALSFFTNLHADLLNLGNKVDLISEQFVHQPYFAACRDSLIAFSSDLLDRVNNSLEVVKLLEDFVFFKTWQQMLVMLQNWQTKSREQIELLLNTFPGHQPHFTLFLTFLKLLRYSIDDMNSFTSRHLAFYYRDILRLKPQKAKADFVHLIVEPATDEAFELPRDTVFPAGKNTNGESKFYISQSAQSFNNAQVDTVLSSFIRSGQWQKAVLKKLNAGGHSFSVFRNDEVQRPFVLLAHPVLWLQSGEREIVISFDKKVIDHTLYDFYVTSEKAFIPLPDQYIQESRLLIPPAEKAIVPYQPEIHKELQFHEALPVVKMVLKKGTDPIKFKKLDIHVHVRNFKSYKLTNDTGEIDASKSFNPFGDFPVNGLSINIGSNEFFTKAGARLSITILTDAPDAKLVIKAIPAVNNAAGGNKILRDNIDRKRILFVPSFADLTDFEYLKDGKWIKVKELDKQENVFTYKNAVKTLISDEDEVFSNKAAQGFVRFRLNHPSFAGQAFLTRFVKGAKAANVRIPEPPAIFSFDVSYQADATLFDKTINIAKSLVTRQSFGSFAGTAFGYRSYTVANVIPRDGEILIGLTNGVPGRAMNMLFQLQEGTANPLKPAATVQWSYLDGNTWRVFPGHLLRDETEGLQQSGIVRFTIPAFNSQSTLVPTPGLFWIKIDVSDPQGICNFYGIHTQALKAVLNDHEKSGLQFTEHTAPKTITESLYAGGEIKSIIQPYASFGGVLAEQDESMNRRVSERLRHKQRAITVWDYERLVLEKFPEVYKVKALNHYRYDAGNLSAQAAGYTTLIVVTRSATDENPVEWKPMPGLGLSARIEHYLAETYSGHVRLKVKPPHLEELKVKCKVKFHLNPGDDAQLLIKKLNDALNRLISPWAFSSADADFIRKVDSSAFIRFIDEQSYVNFVTDFEIFHDGVSVKEILPKTDYSLFKPTAQHLITEIKDNC